MCTKLKFGVKGGVLSRIQYWYRGVGTLMSFTALGKMTLFIDVLQLHNSEQEIPFYVLGTK